MHDPLRSSASTQAKRLWMRMRVLDGANDLRTRVVRVMARRCLIGTDDTCNLRVAGPAVRGVHCLLIRGTRHIVIRSWSPDTLLNGREFSEAVLSAGDRVAVGASEFEVLDAGASTTVDETEQILELLDEPGASLRQIALGEWRSLDRLREAVDLNRARVRRLLEHIQSQQQERHRKIPTRDARRPEPASEERAEEIFDAEPEQPASTSDRGLDECPPAHQVSELHFQEVSTEAPVTANELLNRLRFEPSADEQRGEEPLACPPCCQAEESTARAATDDGTGQPGSRTSVREQTSGEEDESMDACIGRFMERLSSTPARAQPSYLVPNSAGNPTDQSLAKRQAESPPAVAAAEIDRAALLTALPQRSSTAPGRMANLSAMRELAQQQAQFALDVHFRRTFLRTSVRQVLVIVGSLAAGVFFLLLSAHAPLALFVAMIGFVAAFVWSAKYAKALMALADARKRTQPGGNVEKAGMPHPGPAASCELAAAASIHDSEETRP